MLTDLDSVRLYTSRPIHSASRSIRVLQVHAEPDNAQEDDIIECDLSVVDLDVRPHFAALSYVWGPSATGSHQLLCDGVHLNVTENCHSALRHLRKKLGGFSIWIDAVCINQQNLREKEQQIPLMREIYANAYEVYIWLGKGSPATERAMAYLAEGGLKRYYPILAYSDVDHPVRSRLLSALWNCHIHRYSANSGKVPGYLNITNGHTSFIRFPFRFMGRARRDLLVSEDDIEELLHCTWTTRIWTYQEVILASRPVLVSGLDHLPWETLIYSLVLLNRITLMPSIGQWTEIITSRAHYRGTPRAAIVKKLTAYNQFVSTFAKVDSWLARELLGVTASLTLIAPAVALLYVVSPTQLDIAVGGLIALILLVVTLVVCPIMLAIKSFLQRSKSGVLSERCTEFELSLNNRTNQSLLNNICYRQATNPRDLCFGILPMLQHSSIAMRFTVDYAVDLPVLYTQLASFLLEDYGELNILALAAQAKCPGASSWVPDFSVLLRPTSQSTSRYANPRHTSTDVINPVVNYVRQYTTRSALHYTVTHVSDFINTQHLTGDVREAGELHNTRCIMQNPFQNERLLKLYDAKNPRKDEFSTQKPIWTQVFREHFPQQALKITTHRMAEYDASILCCAGDPGSLLVHLTANHLLDVHKAICDTFATSDDLFFITDVQRGVTKLKVTTTQLYGGNSTFHVQEQIDFRCLGYVSGQQQGQLQEGDSVVRIQGIRDHLVYRSSTKALVARLSTQQSLDLKYRTLKIDRSFPTIEIAIQ